MNGPVNNEGIATFGGTTNVRHSAVGRGASVNLERAAPSSEEGGGVDRWDVGVITILPVEAMAVRTALGLRREPVGGLSFDLGEVDADGRTIRVAAIRTLAQGQRSTVIAFDNLRRHYDPKVVLLVGIGGSVHRKVGLGDVVIATRVVYYDLRKVLPGDQTQHRGEEKEAPAAVGHAVNAFFTEYGEPHRVTVADPSGAERGHQVFNGLIGSGDAVIADHEAEIIDYLARFNDKVLAVDMEAGGLSQSCHEQSALSGRVQGWAVVRGISDDAGPGKNDDHQAIASWHAATTLGRLLPYLAIQDVVISA